MLITEEWTAPAVATWKVVAENLSSGVCTLDPSAARAITMGSLGGVLGVWLQHAHKPCWLPTMPAFGLAMAIPASISIAMFLGSLAVALLARYQPGRAQRFVIAAASGMMAGESLVGLVRALIGIAE